MSQISAANTAVHHSFAKKSTGVENSYGPTMNSTNEANKTNGVIEQGRKGEGSALYKLGKYRRVLLMPFGMVLSAEPANIEPLRWFVTVMVCLSFLAASFAGKRCQCSLPNGALNFFRCLTS